jgi:hypothetical protein
MRDRRLADADDADLIGFNELDLDLAKPLGKHGRGHPTRGTAADYRDFAYRLIGCGQISLQRFRAT